MGQTRKINEIGNRHGKLTVVQEAPRDSNNRIMWLCKCDCGKEITVYGVYLRNGDVTGCGSGVCRWGLQPGEASHNRVWRHLQHSAKTRQLSILITKEEFLSLSQRPCFYCGALSTNLAPAKDGGIGDFVYNGLDRIDNTKGYISHNIVSCCHRCNWAKSDLTIGDFYSWAANLYHTFVESKPLVTKTHFPAENLA